MFGFLTRRKFSQKLAYYGVAYKVVYERCDPDNCVTKERFEAVQRTASSILAWAATQSPPLAAAYRRATKDIVARAASVVANAERGRYMMSLYQTLPSPDPSVNIHIRTVTTEDSSKTPTPQPV